MLTVSTLHAVKPLYQRLGPSVAEEGFVVKTIRATSFECPWHAHPEFELILVLESNGYRVVGDHVSEIKSGDLVLVGSDLPHIWKNDAHGPGTPLVHAVLLQFEQRLLDSLLQFPAFAHVRRLLERSRRGLHIVGPTSARVIEIMVRMPGMERYQQFLHLIEVLGILADSTDTHELASPGLMPKAVHFDQERMNRIFEFLSTHLDQCLRLRDVARVINLSESAFSRFFRLHTGRTFPNFVNELRIGRSCRLLVETDKSVTEISYQCGFSNLSNFNRQFLRAKHVTPTIFRRNMQVRLRSFIDTPPAA